MALITCPECGNSISSYAVQCPVCGFPIGEKSRSLDEQLDDILKQSSKEFKAIKKFKEVPFDHNNQAEYEKIIYSLKLAVQRVIDIFAKVMVSGSAFEAYKKEKEFVNGIDGVEAFITEEYRNSHIDINEITKLFPSMVFNALVKIRTNVLNYMERNERILPLDNGKEYYKFCDSLDALLAVGEHFAKREKDCSKRTQMYRILLDWVETSYMYSVRFPVRKENTIFYRMDLSRTNKRKERALERKSIYEKELANLDPNFETTPEKNAKKKEKNKKTLKIILIVFLVIFVLTRIIGLIINISANISERREERQRELEERQPYNIEQPIGRQEKPTNEIASSSYAGASMEITGLVQPTAGTFGGWEIVLPSPVLVWDQYGQKECSVMYFYDDHTSDGYSLSSLAGKMVTLNGVPENYRDGGQFFLYSPTLVKLHETNTEVITKANFESVVDLTIENSHNGALFEIFFNEQPQAASWEYIGTSYSSFSLPEYEFYSFDIYKMGSEYYLIPFNDYTTAPTIYIFNENQGLLLVWSI